jgi:hypothetical protein
VLLVLPPPDHLWIGPMRQVLPCQQFTNARADIPAKILAKPKLRYPPRRSSNANSLWWSELGWTPEICAFESYDLSHAVGSLWGISGSQKYARRH